jgi:FkbM family methyltransferase
VPHQKSYFALKFISSEPDQLFLDVGTNKGQSIESIRLFKPKNPIISFEPNQKLARLLKKRYTSSNNQKVEEFGLGEETGSFRLFVPTYGGIEYDARASLDQAQANRVLNKGLVYAFDESKANLQVYDCQIRSLDSLKLNPFFIKIDVEGTEYRVIKGATETIKSKLPFIMIENLEPGGAIMTLLDPLGYKAYTFTSGTFHRGFATRGDTVLVPNSKKHVLKGPKQGFGSPSPPK